MHHRVLPFFFTALFAGVSPSIAELQPRNPATPAAPAAQPAPPAQPLDEKEIARKLAQLAELAKSLDEMKFGHNSRIIKELRDAGASGDKAFSLWLDCKKTVDFDQEGKSMTEFSEWKRRQTKDPNRERDNELQLQVQWLALVLMDANAKTETAKGETAGLAVQFVDALVERVKKTEGKIGGAARENVMNSVFAKHYKLQSSVGAKEGGAYVPGDVDGIYENMILPFYRSAKQPANLMNAWKKRIDQQTAMADAFPYKEAKDKFVTEKLPELRWGQAKELFLLGQETSASQTMYTIISGNMAHKKASQWMAELTSLLQREPQVAEAAKPAPASPAPAASTTPENPFPDTEVTIPDGDTSPPAPPARREGPPNGGRRTLPLRPPGR